MLKPYLYSICILLALTGCVSKRKYEQSLQNERRAENKSRQLLTQLDAATDEKETSLNKLRKLERENRILIEDTAITAQRLAKYIKLNNEMNGKINDISAVSARITQLNETERTELQRKLTAANTLIDQKNAQITTLQNTIEANRVTFMQKIDSLLNLMPDTVAIK